MPRFIFIPSETVAIDYVTNLIASYSFDTDFSDYTGNNNLTANGQVLAGVTGGKVSDCAELDGSADYAIASDSDDFSFTNGVNDLPFSVAFWVNFDSYASNQGAWMLSKRDTSTNEEYQIIFFGGFIRVDLFSQGGNGSRIAGGTAFSSNIGNWQHFTITYDGSQAFSGLNVYENGVSQTLTDISSGTYLGMANGSQPINIGSRSWSPSSGEFNGKLDEFHVWKNRKLTSSEVLNMYNTENAGNSILP
tara:strand:+ start:18 stop:761 length:744 start_codon:yes stop_codon:yes gene_type:complete